MVISGDTLFFIVEILGTIAFAISGAVIAIDRKLDVFGVVIMACMTACGGGMLRDMMSNTTPAIFRKHIYALASIIGAIVYYLLMSLNRGAAIVVTVVLVTVLRILATHYQWSLPKVQWVDTKKED